MTLQAATRSFGLIELGYIARRIDVLSTGVLEESDQVT